MNIKKLILQKLKKNQSIKVADIVNTTGFSRAYINRFFQQLKEEGKIILIGKANKAHYVTATKKSVIRAKKQLLSIRLILQNKNLSEDIILEKIKKDTGIFIGLNKNISSIVSYAFTEMLNNAIEHSRSKQIEVRMKIDVGVIRFDVIDQGMGIFNNIMRKKKLHNQLEAIQDLLKGKQTTVPKTHTGEGIFFTSKVADILVIKGKQKKLIINNILSDTFIEESKKTIGTKITFCINRNSKRKLDKVFKQYTEDSFVFSKTEVIVKLYKMDSEYISRSQARRIVTGLDKFKTIILDFNKVKTVGQGFTDEVFRVWQSRNPNINITYRNANENIQFMINRAK